MQPVSERRIGKRIAGPLAVVMLIAFFASIISNEVLVRLFARADITTSMVHDGLFGLKDFEYLCELIYLGILTWLGTYHFFSRKWRWMAAIAMVLGLLFSIGYGWHLLSFRNMNEQIVEAVTRVTNTNVDPQHFKSLLLQSSMPIEERSKMSLSHASMEFLATGQPQEFLDIDGKFKPYAPTSGDIKDRDRYLLALAGTQILETRFLWAGVAFILVGLLAFVAGLACHRMDRRARA